jgi:hypothetical protein
MERVSLNETQAHTLSTPCDILLPRLIFGQLRLPAQQAPMTELLDAAN